MSVLPDREARARAATATDCNIVVTAGAGTGKTTLLVDRLLHLLMRQPDPPEIGEIVALTFTNKAANDMKLRLRERLATLLRLDPGVPPPPAQRRDWERMHDLLSRYALTKAVLDRLAATALAGLEKSQIGTIHSFAAHLLRLYPLETGVDPAFQEDEGIQFKDHFNQEWALWLDQELGGSGAHGEVWSAALQQVTLADVKELAAGLTGELIPLDEVASGATGLPPPIREWVAGLADRARTLRRTHGQTLTLERMLDAAISCLESAPGESGASDGSVRDALNRDIPSITKAWSQDDYDQAKEIIKVAQAFGCAGPGPLLPLLEILVPFAEACRRRFVQRGYVSFDGLLARARDLLRDHPAIRRELKQQFAAILVDEFQDTDPVQYEMILYLAEADGVEERDWRKVRLKPGKLFIVGDPKQSIYAFRRADMEAYDAVVEDCVLAQARRGEQHTLKANFRSHSVLLTPINELFARVFPPTAIKGLQPKSDPLLAAEPDAPRLQTERLEMRLVRPAEPETDADSATRAEAEELARWLHEDVLDREEIIEHEAPVTVKPRHVAVLLRTLTTARDYLEAFRRHEIPCLTEGEKHFYERQEIIDAVNLLRAATNPHDVMALVGVLRSPLGALSDAEIEELARKGLLDPRRTVGADASNAASVVPVYALLKELGRELPGVPLPDVIDVVLKHVPLLHLAAASMDREQAVANLLKLRDITIQLAQRPDLTLQGLVAELTGRVLDPPDETESPLAEEGMEEHEQGAVRLLSIHKAKGLEFPMVVLAGLHRGTARQEPRVRIQHDWSTGIAGVRAGELQTVGGIFLGSKLERRRKAEQARILYVGMTRAKRRLVLSAGLPANLANDGFLSQLAGAMGLGLSELDTTVVRLGETEVPVRVVPGGDAPPRPLASDAPWRQIAGDPGRMLPRWSERASRWQAAGRTPLFTTPTALKEAEGDPRGQEWEGRRAAGRDRARLIGTLTHRVLEAWDFSSSPDALPDRIAAVCRQATPPAWTAERSELEAELKKIFAGFTASRPYADLRRATILGREVPFAISWAEGKQVMEGVVDLLFRLDGKVLIADYKTDRGDADEAADRATAYEIQARAYREAVARCLGLQEVGFKFIFVRTGEVVEA